MVYGSTPPPLIEDRGMKGVAVIPQLRQKFIQVDRVRNRGRSYRALAKFYSANNMLAEVYPVSHVGLGLEGCRIYYG